MTRFSTLLSTAQARFFAAAEIVPGPMVVHAERDFVHIGAPGDGDSMGSEGNGDNFDA